ncbi:hypothetical protein ACFLVG_05275 [Chloroflexota bacterium]
MKVIHLYTGPDGESHLEDIEIPLEEKGGYVLQSKTMKPTGVFLRKELAGYRHEWHNASHRQFVITLEGGEGEVEIGDGTKRRFKFGDILWAEDITGRGHISSVVGNEPWNMIVVTLD